MTTAEHGQLRIVCKATAHAVLRYSSMQRARPSAGQLGAHVGLVLGRERSVAALAAAVRGAKVVAVVAPAAAAPASAAAAAVTPTTAAPATSPAKVVACNDGEGLLVQYRMIMVLQPDLLESIRHMPDGIIILHTCQRHHGLQVMSSGHQR